MVARVNETSKINTKLLNRGGAEEARWPHKPEDGGSKPSLGKL